MRKFINGYYRLLNVLLGISVGVLVVPVTIQMFSRFTAADPRVDLDRGDGALPVHLDGDAGRDDRRAR